MKLASNIKIIHSPPPLPSPSPQLSIKCMFNTSFKVPSTVLMSAISMLVGGMTVKQRTLVVRGGNAGGVECRGWKVCLGEFLCGVMHSQRSRREQKKTERNEYCMTVLLHGVAAQRAKKIQVKQDSCRNSYVPFKDVTVVRPVGWGRVQDVMTLMKKKKWTFMWRVKAFALSRAFVWLQTHMKNC